MDKLAYHYNKKKLPAKTEGKYLYYYPCEDMESATVQMGGRGFVTIEVSEKEWEALIELDRIEYNNEHKYVRHTVAIPDCEEDNLTAKQQEQLHVKDTPIDTATAEYYDKQVLYNQLTEDEETVLAMIENGFTQKYIANELGVTQGYVSMIKAQAQYNYDYAEQTTAIKTNCPEYLWKCWNLFTKKLEMPMFLDIEMEYVLRHIHPNDIAHFLYWYYSLGEFVRFSIRYYLYNEESLEKEKSEYLSKASDQELAWFLQNYADAVPLVQIVYTNVIPPIVEEKLFRECNLIMDSHKHKQRKNYDEQPYILSGKLFCGYCESAITAEAGTSKTGRVYHYYKCYGKKLKTTDCHKKPVSQDFIETIVFEATIKYVLRPKVIDKIAEMVTEKFNAEISTPTVLLSLEKELKEVNKSINGIMTAIENGIFTKTTKERLLNLEAEQSELENKIAVEQARQTKPLQVNEVKKFLTYFAYMKYEKGEEKNEFFNSFIKRVILYDDKVIILYNSNDREIKRLSKKQLKDIENAETLEDIKENSLEPKKFKRVALGAEKGI